MRAAVVYESTRGNAREVAHAIGEGLAEHAQVVIAEVCAADPALITGVDLVVVGGPSRAAGASRPGAHAVPPHAAEPFAAGTEVREWLTECGTAATRAAGAAFGTTAGTTRPAAAALDAETLLRRLGYRIAAGAESFRLAGVKGPLAPGELARARAWGVRLGAAIGSSDVCQPVH